jgi:hypothetical protein
MEGLRWVAGLVQDSPAALLTSLFACWLKHFGVFRALLMGIFSQMRQLIKAVWSMAIPSREGELPLWDEGACSCSTIGVGTVDGHSLLGRSASLELAVCVTESRESHQSSL